MGEGGGVDAYRISQRLGIASGIGISPIRATFTVRGNSGPNQMAVLSLNFVRYLRYMLGYGEGAKIESIEAYYNLNCNLNAFDGSAPRARCNLPFNEKEIQQ